MAVLLLGEVTNGELNRDATGKAVNKIATYSKTGEFVNPKVEPRKSVPFLIGEDEDEVAALRRQCGIGKG